MLVSDLAVASATDNDGVGVPRTVHVNAAEPVAVPGLKASLRDEGAGLLELAEFGVRAELAGIVPGERVVVLINGFCVACC